MGVGWGEVQIGRSSLALLEIILGLSRPFLPNACMRASGELNFGQQRPTRILHLEIGCCWGPLLLCCSAGRLFCIVLDHLNPAPASACCAPNRKSHFCPLSPRSLISRLRNPATGIVRPPSWTNCCTRAEGKKEHHNRKWCFAGIAERTQQQQQRGKP